MAENPPPAKKKLPIPPLQATAYTIKKSKQKQTEEQKKAKKRESDRPRDKTRVNIGIAFLRWRKLRDLKGFKTDAELATFLFDRDGEFSEAGVQELDKSISGETALQKFDARDDGLLNLGQYEAGFAKHLKIKPGSVPTVSNSTTDMEAASASSASFQFPASRHVACQTDLLKTPTVGTPLFLLTLKPQIRIEGVQASVSCKEFDVGTSTADPFYFSSSPVQRPSKQADDPLQTSSSVAASKGLDSTCDPADSVATLTESTSLSYGRYIQGPSISTSVKHVVQGPPVPSRSSIGVESERSLLDSRVHTEDNQVVLNSSCIKSGDCTEAVLDSRAVKSEELEESIEGRNGYGLCQEEEPSVANIKQEENLWMWKLVKREVGVTVKTGVVGVAKLKEEEWNGHVQELEALDLKKERDGGTVEQTDRVLTEDGRLHCRSPAAEGSTPPVTYCLLKQQPAVRTSGHPPMSNSGLSVVFACSQCPFIHKEEAKLLQHIEKAHPEEYKMILGYV